MGIVANESKFQSLINEGLILVDFFATWCGPCRMLESVLDDIANERNELKIIKLDVDENIEVARQYGVFSVPTLILFKKGQLMAKTTGYMPKELLTKWIEENK